MLLNRDTNTFDYFGEVALGKIAKRSSVNKFGYSVSGIQATETDVWDRADATPTQSVWLAPTAARIHTIASTSSEDDTGGTGVNSVDVYYLADWDTKESIETVTGDLNGGIAMTNAAVMINRMVCTPQATTTVGVNKGIITATAATDSAVTAAILVGNGQTEMAIYGFASTQTVKLYGWYGAIDKAGGAVGTIDFLLRFNPNPDTQTVAFLRKGDISVQSTGKSADYKHQRPPIIFDGPGILKVSGIGSANDLDAKAGFDLIVVDD